ncbi:hypothetical protein [Paenibacillus nasutitermitis]|uniref:Uncharacterized protein n=1 Tax=Paenibacillus nasutitermitis TaxID=1652958 RepID=A0A917DTA2_9BACL|nr:hypothetical protein [Paenibacillus nasutitermitis]GGD68900.1 hypothetical protein GCM10010911_28360 [Paenibacillus nasutitermitis]
MKIRWVPTLITAVLSACLLVGGWYIYRNMTTIRPLEQITAQIPGVTEAKPEIGRDTVTVELTLDKNADIRAVYDKIYQEGKSVIGGRELKLQIRESTDQQKLDTVWSSMLFGIAQAMDHRNYSDIPQTLKQAEQQFSGIQAVSEMDESNVYITLRDGDDFKHIVLPRIAAQMGAWPNA